MLRTPAALMLAASLVAVFGCGQQATTEDPADAAFAELREAWNNAETAADKTALAEAYLAEYPDSDHSGTMAGIVAYYRGDQMDDPAGAWAVLSTALDAIDDPEHRFEVAMAAFDLADDVEIPIDVAEVAGSLADVRALTYSEHSDVMEAAIVMADWEEAVLHADAALQLSTPEQYREDYPDLELTDDQVASRAQHRRASALAAKGWATFNLGDRELAEVAFAEAEAAGSVNYLGVPATPLYRYWGRAELAEGHLDRALELLSAEMLFGENRSEAEPYLREAYAAKFGSDEGLGEYLWSTRNRLAKPAVDFELPDYQGASHKLSDTAGNVTLLAFWFPT